MPGVHLARSGDGQLAKRAKQRYQNSRRYREVETNAQAQGHSLAMQAVRSQIHAVTEWPASRKFLDSRILGRKLYHYPPATKFDAALTYAIR